MKRLVCLGFIIAVGGCQCTDDPPIVELDTGSDSSFADVSDSGVDMQTTQIARRNIFVTSGGGSATSESVRAKISIGAPQPAGVVSGSQTNLKLGPAAGLER